MNEALLQELFDLIRIPSISSGGGDPHDLRRAAQWICDKIEASGGTAGVDDTTENPLAVGRLEASVPDAPTVLIYGHYDVQSPEPVMAWDSPPFEPEIREDRVYGRGAADDKGNFFPLLYVACELAGAGRLPVNVRVLVEGEEEIGSPSIGKWISTDDEGADCVVIFDSTMVDPETPALTLSVRGLVSASVEVRTAVNDLHSGVFGGSALNAAHVLHQVLAEVLPGRDGRLRPELRKGLVDPDPIEVESWTNLPAGEMLIGSVGGRPTYERSGEDHYRQTWADASLDVNGVASGDAVQRRTIIPATASAKLSMRLSPDQIGGELAETLKGLLLDAAPPHADVEVTIHSYTDPASFDPASPVLQAAAASLERVCRKAPVLVRSGGSIPIMASFAQRGIPTVLSGFALNDDAFHAPNESFRVRSLELAEAAARDLYESLAKLEG